MILTGFFMVPRVLFALEVISDGNGRSDREVGNDGFRIAGARAGCRDGVVGEASGDDTRGRVVLTASGIVDPVIENEAKQEQVGDARGGIRTT
jgi:hypothetical protein